MAELFESGGSEGQAGPGAEPDTAAVAIALDRASRRKGRAANDEIDRFLGKQEALIERQVRRLDEELHHMRLRHFSERLKVGLQLLTMLVGVLALAAVGAMAWSASRDNSLVIEGFGVPPDLAEQGTTGTAVASRLHDKLSEMQAQTVTVRAAVTVRDNSAARVKVEIPETGVSLGEVDQML
ncbi:MAG TPA: hypothetical protein VFN88_11955, partial [Caulobacteraceae bacterium]|nr:hypothetical protein [Caulobacteraceae bacterium]